MQNDKISIISIIYDVEPFVRQCLESIASQTYSNIEIILVATRKEGEHSYDIAQEFAEKDSRIKLIDAPHSGRGDARNRGLEAASGSYIGFVDGDDFIEADMYEKLHESICRNAADIAVCGKITEYKNESVPDERRPELRLKPQDAFRMIMKNDGFFLHCWDKLFRASLFENLRFPADKYQEDRFTVGKAIEGAGCIVYDNVPLYHYRVRAASGSNIRRMSEFNTDADMEIYSHLAETYPELKGLCSRSLIYDHITCIQNYMLYFEGKNDTEADGRMKMHLDYVRSHKNDKDCETDAKFRFKIFICLHMRWLLRLITKYHTRKDDARHEPIEE